jgi:hypothetical protein
MHAGGADEITGAGPPLSILREQIPKLELREASRQVFPAIATATGPEAADMNGLVDLEAIRSASPILEVIGEHVRLRRSGAQWIGLCPFHNEKTPSFSVHPEKAVFRCHGCGVGGDVFRFVEVQRHCSFPQAVRFLAARAGIDVGFAPSPEVAARVDEVRRKKEAEQAFREWENTCYMLLMRRLWFLERRAALAKRVLHVYPDCEPAWAALADFCHGAAHLSAAFETLAYEKVPNYLGEPMTRAKLRAAFDEVIDRSSRAA